ncbi:histone protein, partial [Streptomyces cinereoruber]
MDDTSKIALAAAVAGGYVLGRTKKGRLAFTAATYLAGRRFGLEPRQLLTEGLSRLKDIPQVAEMGDQLKGETLNVGRQALKAAADRKLADLADSLHERTLAIGSGGDEEDEEGRYEDEEEDRQDQEGYEDEEEPEEPEEYDEDEDVWEEDEEPEEDGEDEEAEEDEPEEQEEPEPSRSSRPSSRTRKPSRARGTAPAKKTAPAGKSAPAKKAATK